MARVLTDGRLARAARRAGPGTGWFGAWLLGGTSAGPDQKRPMPYSKNQSSAGSKD